MDLDEGARRFQEERPMIQLARVYAADRTTDCWVIIQDIYNRRCVDRLDAKGLEECESSRRR